jgi:hypothetical protein
MGMVSWIYLFVNDVSEPLQVSVLQQVNGYNPVQKYPRVQGVKNEYYACNFRYCRIVLGPGSGFVGVCGHTGLTPAAY